MILMKWDLWYANVHAGQVSCVWDGDGLRCNGRSIKRIKAGRGICTNVIASLMF